MTPVASRGRPVDPAKQKEQKQKLIQVTLTLMNEKSYRDITIRELAAAAGINPAMVRYYFGNKEALVLESFKTLSSQCFEDVQDIFAGDNPVKSLIHFMLQLLTRHAGLARILHDEMLNRESSLSEAIIDGFPKRMATALPELIAAEAKRINPEARINAKYSAFNLISMIVMPIVGAPVRRQAWGITDAEIASPEWAEHIYHQFMYGLTGKPVDV
ncbi:TetR/AcrR family transcriptional regulator [Spongorhabdus nitratireducens]